MKMEFEKMIGSESAKIEAKSDKYDKASVRLEGRGIDLLALSMEVAKDVIENTSIDVDSYCEILKEGFNGKKR